MCYDDLLSLMGEDIVIAKNNLLINDTGYEEYSRQINEIAKSGHIVSFVFCESGEKVIREDSGVDLDWWIAPRIMIIHNWLEKLTSLIRLPNFRIAVDASDMAMGGKIPILSFNKKIGDNLILIPDFEIFEKKYYCEDKWVDKKAFPEKLDKAIFSGATTGTNYREDRSTCNTLSNIENDPSVRIDAAKFFLNSSSTIFRLPSIVQCDSSETEDYLKRQEYTLGGFIDWSEQLKYKFIISVDGNGPTCTRVASVLLSHSVLLKYKSEWIVYYHRLLRPYINYLPVMSHCDVDRFVEDVQSNQEFYLKIAKKSSQDFSVVFKPFNVDRFFSVVLNEFYSLFYGRNDVYLHNKAKLSAVFNFYICVHYSNLGDVWLYQDDLVGRTIDHDFEGLTIYPASNTFECQDFLYQVMFEDGEIGDLVTGGVFAGSRGLGRKVTGFKFLTSSEANASVSCKGYFKNKSQQCVGPGCWLRNDDSPIQSIEFVIE